MVPQKYFYNTQKQLPFSYCQLRAQSCICKARTVLSCVHPFIPNHINFLCCFVISRSVPWEASAALHKLYSCFTMLQRSGQTAANFLSLFIPFLDRSWALTNRDLCKDMLATFYSYENSHKLVTYLLMRRVSLKAQGCSVSPVVSLWGILLDAC